MDQITKTKTGHLDSFHTAVRGIRALLYSRERKCRRTALILIQNIFTTRNMNLKLLLHKLCKTNSLDQL